MKLTKICLTSLAVLAPVGANAALIFHSEMDGNADAIVGTDGVAGGTGTPSAATDRDGNVGGATAFNGDSYFDIGNLGTFSAGTISAWILTTSNAGETGPLNAGASGGGTDQYFSVMNQNSGFVRADLDDGVGRADVQSPAAMNLDQWYHVAITFTAQDTLTLYIDGVSVDTQDISGAAANYVMTSNALIGAERTTERFWNGSVDEVRIYDNELSALEVQSLAGIPEPSTALLGLASLGLLLRRKRA